MIHAFSFRNSLLPILTFIPYFYFTPLRVNFLQTLSDSFIYIKLKAKEKRFTLLASNKNNFHTNFHPAFKPLITQFSQKVAFLSTKFHLNQFSNLGVIALNTDRVIVTFIILVGKWG